MPVNGHFSYISVVKLSLYSKTCLKLPISKRPQIGFQDQLSLNAGQTYCRMLQREHSAILSTFIKLPFVIKIFIFSILSGRFTQVLLYNTIHYNTVHSYGSKHSTIKELHYNSPIQNIKNKIDIISKIQKQKTQN